MLKRFFLVVVLLMLVGCSGEQGTTISSQSANAAAKNITASSSMAENPGAANHSLMFFLDPNGGPCKMQDSILTGMAEEFKDRVNVRYVKTTVQSDMDLFYAFGVRALPTLLLVDSNGKEVKRMVPGVKNVAAIRDLIKDITPAG